MCSCHTEQPTALRRPPKRIWRKIRKCRFFFVVRPCSQWAMAAARGVPSAGGCPSCDISGGRPPPSSELRRARVWPGFLFGFLGAGGRLPKARRGRAYRPIRHNCLASSGVHLTSRCMGRHVFVVYYGLVRWCVSSLGEFRFLGERRALRAAFVLNTCCPSFRAIKPCIKPRRRRNAQAVHNTTRRGATVRSGDIMCRAAQ